MACLGFLSNGSAQWYNPDKVNKKAVAVYEAAYDLAVNGDYPASIAKIEQALLIEPKYIEAYLSRAGIYAELNNYPKSVLDFEKALSLDSVFSSPYLLPYSISLAGTGNFDKALWAVNQFLQFPSLNKQSIQSANYRKSTYEFAIDYTKTHPKNDYHFSPVNVGSGINTVALEYYPSLTIDGKKMIFNRRVNNDEDFYESDFINGTWTEALPVPGKINTNLNEGAQNISQDGEWLIFTGCNYPEGMGSCDLYISYKKKNGSWSEAINLGDKINTDQWESAPSLSPDKKDLYFSSNRMGGYGGKDIWVSHRNNNGTWGLPKNLGPVINTSADETCPFIHADNSTLYFNSNGHPGYGQSDIFLSRKIADSIWGKPENLGYPINTINDEGSLVVASDGKTSYYASDRGNHENALDIYSFDLRNDVRAAKTLWIKGKVFDKKTNVGLPCTVELFDLYNQKDVSSIQTDEEGNYLITLPAGKEYGFNVNRKGFLFHSDHFALNQENSDHSHEINIPLQPIEPGASVILKNIFFDNNQYHLQSTSYSELDKLVWLLQENKKIILQISGHTDNVGSKENNNKLSQQRAQAVAQYLVSKGIASNRLVAKGFGDTKPIQPNNTEEGKSLNRRTEINILSN